ncbi:glucokinase PWA37_002816 [Arxiozyma heterogenica]|uniref:glucokinase n=1 Tax=Arxiozyma heterogenica TaxID=278026 RepID=UPI002F25B074
MSFDDLHKAKTQQLNDAVDSIVKEFEITPEKLEELTEYFIEQMEKGLAPVENKTTDKGLPMIPSFVTSTPNGTEQGILLAADLGGTNFRVCSVTLNGDHTYSMEQMKSKIPDELLESKDVTSDQLFGYLARRTLIFLKKYHPDYLSSSSTSPSTSESLRLGFTFSYPVDQTSLNSGTLIRWTKGFNIPDTVGKDVVRLYQDQLNQLGLEFVNVVAMTNDTVGTFLSHCYTSNNTDSMTTGEISEPIIGCIFGTGTNGCYMEEVNKITKLPASLRERLLKEGKTHMVINTEWGSFDNELKHLPVTKYDVDIDQKFSANPGFHLFEKRVSGMFLGELLRNILVDLHSRGLIFNQYRTKEQLPHQLSLLQSLRLPTSPSERLQIQKLVRAISRRSAYLSAVPLAAITIKTGVLNKRYHGEVEIGCDGSVVEYYPGFRSMLRHALALSPLGAEGERKIHIKLAKDGSGVGAALCALVA